MKPIRPNIALSTQAPEHCSDPAHRPTGRPTLVELLDAAADFGAWLAEQDSAQPTHPTKPPSTRGRQP